MFLNFLSWFIPAKQFSKFENLGHEWGHFIVKALWLIWCCNTIPIILLSYMLTKLARLCSHWFMLLPNWSGCSNLYYLLTKMVTFRIYWKKKNTKFCLFANKIQPTVLVPFIVTYQVWYVISRPGRGVGRGGS